MSFDFVFGRQMDRVMSTYQELLERLVMADIWEKTLELDRNAYLVIPGKVDQYIYFIESGSVRIYFEDEFEEQVLRLGYSGNIIGALNSYLTGEPSNVYIQTIKKSTIKALPKQAFDHFLARNQMASAWQKLLEQLLYEQLERERDILTYSPKERYLRVLKRSPQLFQEIPAKYIASYLRMSPETLSRLKKS